MMRYTLDPDAATVAFNASTSLHPVVARAPVTGWLEAEINDGRFVEGAELSGRLEIAVESIRSGNSLYDAETRRRINVGANPLIVAEITSTLAITDTSATVEGNVSFHGGTVLLEGELHLGPGQVLTGEGTVDIRWWDLHPPRLLAFKVEPNVVISVEIPLVEEA